MLCYERPRWALAPLCLILVACERTDGAAVAADNKDAGTSAAPASAQPEPERPVPTTATGPAPVEVRFARVNGAEATLVYTVRILATKPVRNVEFRTRYLDAKGKELKVEDVTWQNLVNGRRLPIEPGQTYEVEDKTMAPGTIITTHSVTSVSFADETKWKSGP